MSRAATSTHGRVLSMGEMGRITPEQQRKQDARKGVRCADESCSVKLAWSNPGDYCGVHEFQERKRWSASYHLRGEHA